jgi:hypothetical protein
MSNSVARAKDGYGGEKSEYGGSWVATGIGLGIEATVSASIMTKSPGNQDTDKKYCIRCCISGVVSGDGLGM